MRNKKVIIPETNAYRIVRFFMSLIGQWPYQNARNRLLLRIFIVIVLLIGVSVLVITVYTANFDKSTVIDLFPIFMSEMVCWTKFLHCWIQNDAMKHFLEEIRCDWYALEVQEEVDILHMHVEKGKFYGLYYICMVYTGVVMFLLAPFAPIVLDIIIPLNESRPHFLPFTAEYFVDQEKYFYLLLGHADLSVVVVLTIYVSSDTIFITILSHATALFAVLGITRKHFQNGFSYKLQHIYDDIDNCEKIYLNVASCVRYHKRILQFIETVQVCYNAAYVIQAILAIIISTILLLHLFLVITDLQDIGDVIISVVHLLGYYITVLYNIIPGQRLMDKSSTIFHKAYCGNWYMAPPKAQKMLLLIMQRNRHPTVLKSAYVLSLTFDMYGAMVQTSLSYFTVLYSIQ